MTDRAAIVVETLLAQSPRAVEIVGRGKPSILELSPYALPAVGTAACLALLASLGVRAVAERTSTRTPADRRLVKVARRMGLTRADMEMLKRLASAHGGAEAAALLLSAHAFRESVSKLAAGIVTSADRERIQAIAVALGCTAADLFGERAAPARPGRGGGTSVVRRRAPDHGERRLSA